MDHHINRALINGELDNTTPDTITGWLNFATSAGTTRVDVALNGNFSADIRGTKIRIRPDRSRAPRPTLSRLPAKVIGEVGEMTAGFQNPVNHKYGCANHNPVDHRLTPIRRGHLEWTNRGSRWIVALERKQIRVLGKRWGMLTGDHTLDTHLTSVGFQTTTLGGRSALSITHQNGVREIRPVSPEQMNRITEVVADFSL